MTDPAGKTATGTTGADGNVAVGLGSVSGGKYRVQVNPPAGSPLVPAPAGTGIESNMMFVDVAGQGHQRHHSVVEPGRLLPVEREPRHGVPAGDA
ncbi:hypothetical protein FXN61_36375 [Lentzea sp. PSKA42]|uniref:SD-repeat containing protein B domain-containing protein n=1 Tax=Lentzea indica TaxID=2604800 RepID=A0ABX1FTJ8_9PSEU|nr:hypothetical protein [Lentzea indica]NKE61946.1 hypothetical protein [Lentzea indica]